MRHVTNRTWMPAQIEELRQLVEAGASPVKAAARLKRSILSVQIKAKDLGYPFADKRVVKRRRLMREAEVRRKMGLQ
ncbi:hypothetical protein V1291_004857 [Nitrobacteraceae bacterium AZCC 1564]